MPSEQRSNESSTPTLGEIVGVLLPQIEKIEEGFQAVRMTLEGLAGEFGRGPVSSGVAVRTESSAAVEPPPIAPKEKPAEARAAEQPTAPPEPPPSEPAPEPAAELPPTVEPSVSPRPVARPSAARPEPIPVARQAGNMSQIVFGDQAKSVPSAGRLSSQLLSAMYSGDNDAIGLIGQLMQFRTGNAEQMARMLKDVGEAFYRWKPSGGQSELQALIDWVHAVIEEAGLRNHIEIVQVGDRYDMQRHNAKERGIEVSEVGGWVVLRDNGKVYSKANVSVR